MGGGVGSAGVLERAAGASEARGTVRAATGADGPGSRVSVRQTAQPMTVFRGLKGLPPLGMYPVFHGRKAVAPLKQVLLERGLDVACCFPRSKGRGSIEASSPRTRPRCCLLFSTVERPWLH